MTTKPSAALTAAEDLASLEESIAILSDPGTMRRLATSDAEIARGEGKSEADLAQALDRRHAYRSC